MRAPRSTPDYQKPAWDTFESIPIEDTDETLSSEWSKFFLKLFKLISYGITFLFVLFFGVVSKLSMHLIASMTQVGDILSCCSDLSANLNFIDQLILKVCLHVLSLLGEQDSDQLQ